MNSIWKFRCALIVAGLVLGFTVYRGRQTFYEEAPAWMRLQSRRSPALPDEVLTPWLTLRHQLDLAAKQNAQPIKSVQFFVITKSGKQMLVCNLETLTNPGFAPANQFQVSRWTSDQNIVGCYTLDGAPLTIRLKHHPTYPKVAFLSVETRDALAPGASLPVLNVEQRPLALRPDAVGYFTQSLPRVPSDDTTINAVAIGLPTTAILKTYRPEDGAYLSTKDAPLVTWINCRLDAHAPAPSIIFKLH